MPILIIYGVPSHTAPEHLLNFMVSMQETTSNVKALKVKENQVSVFCPPDLVKTRAKKEIVVWVQGLFEKKTRTKKVKDKLATELVKCAREFFPDTHLIECFVESFNPRKSGFAS